MFGFNQREKRIFCYSLFLHFFGACFLFALGLIPSCEEETEEIHVFELAMSSEQPIVQQPSLPNPPPPKPKPPTALPPPKPVVQAKPKPPPPVQTKAPPVRSKPEITPPVAKPKTLPKAKPKAPPTPPKVVSFKDFQKNNKITSPKPAPRPPVAKPIVKIDPNRFKLSPIKLSNRPNTASSNVPASVLNAYLALVKSKLERAWKSKLGASSIINGGEACLSFKISTNGRLFGKRISKSSGNKDLDRLVLAAANLVSDVGIPPGGKLESELQIPFRLN